MKMEIVKGEGGMSEILKEFKKALQCLDEKQMTAWLTHKLCVFSSCTDLYLKQCNTQSRGEKLQFIHRLGFGKCHESKIFF